MSYKQLFPNIPDYAKDYLYYLMNVKNFSPKTVHGYYMDLHLFFQFLADYYHLTSEPDFQKIDATVVGLETVKKVSLSDIYVFLSFVSDERKNNARTRARKISSLRGFYKYLTKQAIIDENPTQYLEVPKQKSSLPVHLSLSECVRLLESIDGSNKERDLCMITFFLHCGLRLSELDGINLSDIVDKRVLRVRGKGNKERDLFLNDSCVKALDDYLAVRLAQIPKAGHEDALFIGRSRTRLSNRQIQKIVKKFIEKAGLDTVKYSTHKLRHTAATLMYQNGVDIRVLKDVLGHANLGTTQIYTHVGNQQIEAAIQENPLDEIALKNKSASVLNAADIALRNQCIAQLEQKHALNVHELQNLEMQQIDLHKKTLQMMQDGVVVRTITLDDDLFAVLQKYIERKKQKINNSFLFVSETGKKISQSMLQKIILAQK